MGQGISGPLCHVDHWPKDSEWAMPPSPLSLAALTSELCYACSEGNLPHVNVLLQQNVDVNSVDYDRQSPLHLAAREGHLEVVKFLLDAGAKANQKDRWGRTSLDEAKSGRHAEIQELLIKAGAGQVEEDSGFSPRKNSVETGVLLNCAAAAGSIHLLEDLFAKKANLSDSDYDGRTPLHLAASHGHQDVVTWLLEHKADVNRHDNHGMTPLNSAMRMNKKSCVEVLLNHGADDFDCHQILDVRVSGLHHQWVIPGSEVELGKVLRQTSRTVLYRAKWRGTDVVAKKAVSVLACNGNDVEVVNMNNRQATETQVIHEITVLSKIRHPDLVMFLGAVFDNSTPFFINEYMPGGDLQTHFMRETGKLGHPFRASSEELLRWSNAIARSLCFLHGCSRPVIHRDLKPQNLLLTATGDIKVSDFGISKLMAPRDFQTATAPSTRKSSKEFQSLHLSWYVAPEVLREGDYTDRVDVYSFALLMWFMCAGKTPFADQFEQDIHALLAEYRDGAEPRPDFTLKGAKFPPVVRALIQECWHREPQSRPAAAVCCQRLADLAAEDAAEALRTPLGAFSKRRGA